MFMSYQDFNAKYVNKKSRNTGMYYTTEEAAKDAGIPLDLAEAYVKAVQIAHAVAMKIMDAGIAVEAYNQQVLPLLTKYADQLPV